MVNGGPPAGVCQLFFHTLIDGYDSNVKVKKASTVMFKELDTKIREADNK